MCPRRRPPVAGFLLNSQIKNPARFLDVEQHLTDAGIFVERVWDWRFVERGRVGSGERPLVQICNLWSLRLWITVIIYIPIRALDSDLVAFFRESMSGAIFFAP